MRAALQSRLERHTCKILRTGSHHATDASSARLHRRLSARSHGPIPWTQVQITQIAPEYLGSFSWNWQIGSTPPERKIAIVQNIGIPTTFTAYAATTHGTWLSVSPSQGQPAHG